MPDSMPGDVDASLDIGEEDFDLDGQGHVVPEEAGPPVCPSKPSAGNKRVRAQFGRKRTHNEQYCKLAHNKQIIVAPCGVIIARTTFYGAEAVSSVAKFVKQVYRKAPRPEHIIFDNNCSLAKVVKGDPFFQDIGLSVDVFHFSCKHSITATFCQEHCNPRAYQELVSEGGGWFFNSSIAEQTNVWLGGFHSICREMHVVKYNFFLDEMIMRRNKLTFAKLEADGHEPSYWKDMYCKDAGTVISVKMSYHEEHQLYSRDKTTVKAVKVRVTGGIEAVKDNVGDSEERDALANTGVSVPPREEKSKATPRMGSCNALTRFGTFWPVESRAHSGNTLVSTS
ncbi:hypothetical protein BC835DRAFT_1308521 [Cytidiella melzeri]|nr:hypothetical protein BC835DRAFT_1308521 [Cytidiella melzeri]